MTEYLFHWWPFGTTRPTPPIIKLQADSHLHGAALALRQFMKLGTSRHRSRTSTSPSRAASSRPYLSTKCLIGCMNRNKGISFAVKVSRRFPTDSSGNARLIQPYRSVKSGS
jgi:hypothetical protein